MNQDRKWLLYLFFPVTAYLFVGTTLLFLVYKTDVFSEKLGNYSGFPMLDKFDATEWHNRSIWLTVFFPVVWPLLIIWSLIVFFYAIVAATLRLIYDILVSILNWIIDSLVRIWTWTIDSIEYIWQEIRSTFRAK